MGFDCVHPPDTKFEIDELALLDCDGKVIDGKWGVYTEMWSENFDVFKRYYWVLL